MEIKDCISRGIFCLVYGATGTGKTYNIMKAAEEMGYNVMIQNGSEVKAIQDSGIDFENNKILYVIDNLDMAPKNIQKEAMKHFIVATTNDLYSLPREYRDIKNKRQYKRPNLGQKLKFVRSLNDEMRYGLTDIDIQYIVSNSNNYWELINNSKLLYASSISDIPLNQIPELNVFEEFRLFMEGKIDNTKMTEYELEIWALDNTNAFGKSILSIADILLGNEWSGFKNPRYAKEVIRLVPIGNIKFPKIFTIRRPEKEKPKKKEIKPKKKKVSKPKQNVKSIFDFI